ncbi:MAG: sulfatase [Saprospiraceae bacterium]
MSNRFILSMMNKNTLFFLTLLTITASLCFSFLIPKDSPIVSMADRPNIVWLVSEDNSKHYLKLYEEGGAAMPTIEKLAKEGIVFNHAFSNAAVCSVARSTLISGCYAPRVGTQYHRRTEFAPLPEGLDMFPAYLREAGYYTSNNSKEDYNFVKSEKAWDESSNKASYRKRKEGQPFFHVQNFGRTHEGQLHFTPEEMASQKTITAPQTVPLFPYHPDTPTFRYTNAKYRDLHMEVDAQIGEFIQQLEADGLMDDTIIFYYGDHGGVLPRGKGYIYESGLHVPLVVYVPKKWQHLSPASPGSRVDGFVQFIDMGPTVLNLAGVTVPKQMDGKAFLGQGVDLKSLNAQDVAFSYADRFDEKYDLVRAIRIGRYKYMRNFQPFNFDGLYNFYRYKMLAYQEWRSLYEEGKLNAAQKQFFEPRPAECLYDLEKDPHEMNNLAKDLAYASQLAQARKAMDRQLKAMPDLSFYPEPYFLEKGLQNPVQFGQDHKKDIAKLIDIANLSLKPFAKAKKAIEKALDSSNPWERYWGWIVCSSFGEQAAPFYPKARELSGIDPNILVRTRAVEFLGLTAQQNPVAVLKEVLKRAKNETEANLILNTIVLLKDTHPSYVFDLSNDLVNPDWMANPNDLVNRRMEYLKGK